MPTRIVLTSTSSPDDETATSDFLIVRENAPTANAAFAAALAKDRFAALTLIRGGEAFVNPRQVVCFLDEGTNLA